jgi:hypothetical protein
MGMPIRLDPEALENALKLREKLREVLAEKLREELTSGDPNVAKKLTDLLLSMILKDSTGAELSDYIKNLNIAKIAGITLTPRDWSSDLAKLQNIDKVLSNLASKTVSVFIDNGLDQAVTVQLKANRENAYAKSVNVGSAFTVNVSGQDSRTLTPDSCGWLPYITVEVSCATAPTSGALDIYLVRTKDDQPKLVDSLAIRDTQAHNASTDSTKIFILEW